MSSFAKGNPFSLFFGTPFFGTPCFLFFLFFLSPAKVGSLEMQPGAKLQAYLGVSILQPHASTQRFRLRILRRTRSNAGRTSARSLSGRTETISLKREHVFLGVGVTQIRNNEVVLLQLALAVREVWNDAVSYGVGHWA